MKTNQKKEQLQQKLSLHEKKHQVNLKNNSSLHFQIGLITALLIIFGVFQLQFEKQTYTKPIALTDVPDIVKEPINYIIEKPKVDVVKKKLPKRKKQNTNYKQVNNNDTTPEELPFIDKPVAVPKAPAIDSIQVVEIDDDVTLPVNFVQILPTFPGCEKFKTKKEKMACLNKKIAKHISRKFNSDIAAENGLTGRQKIMVMFTINKQGNIVDIKARAPHPALQKEAIKAVQSLPKMKPAKQGYKKVSVTFTQPIIFKVE